MLESANLSGAERMQAQDRRIRARCAAEPRVIGVWCRFRSCRSSPGSTGPRIEFPEDCANKEPITDWWVEEGAGLVDNGQ